MLLSRSVLFCALIFITPLLKALPEKYVFETEYQKHIFQGLVKECRCVTCPNQSIADSQAPIANAMKDEIYNRVKQGESRENIRDYLQSNYGDYVLYNPPMKQSTWMLWILPVFMLLLGLFYWFRL